MLRVLMLSKACIVGIYQRKLELIARHDIDLLALVPPAWKDERGVQRLERVYTEGYRLETLPITFNGNFHLHFYPGLGTAIHRFQPDIVHIDEEPYNLATWQALHLARGAGAKTIFFTWQNIKRDYPPPFAWGEKWVLNHADAAIAGTESAAQVWREKGYAGTLVTIPQFGTDPDLFTPLSDRPQRPFTLGYLGRLVEEKGVHLLLDALTKLPADSDWRLRIVGSGPLRADLVRQVERLGLSDCVQFIDWMPSTEIPAEYHRLDALVLPSLTRPNWKEQFGRVLVEAMGSGVPVIGSDSGAIPGVVGDGGLIVPEGDADALAEAICTLMDNPAHHADLARKGRARVLAHFTHEQVARATVDLYRALVGSATSSG